MHDEKPAKRELLIQARREAWLQIYLPVIAITTLAIAAAILIGLKGQAPGASTLADLSLIVLIIPTLVLGLFALGVLIALAVGVAWLIQNTTPYTGRLQEITQSIHLRVDAITNRIANFVITIRSFLAGVEALVKQSHENGQQETSEDSSKTGPSD